MEVAHMSQPSSQQPVPSQAPKKAKKIFLYRNGLGQDGKAMVINDRVVRDFSTLLTYATSGLKAPVAIRNLYTPQNGHRVGNLDDLQSGQVYVAAGQEKFKKIKYGAPKLLPKRRGNPYVMVPSRREQAVVASARYKKPTLKPFYIHVFRNGDENFRGVRVLLTQRTLYSMDHVLELVMEKAELFTSASRLCNMDGTPVKTLSQLENGKQYVVIEGNKPFKKVRYCTHDTITESKRVGDGGQGMMGKTKQFTASGGYVIPHPPPNKPTRMRKFTREERPMGGRKDKEKREKALEDQRADSVFGASKRKPKQALLVTSQLLHDQVEEDGDNKNHPLDESSLLQSTTNSIDTHTNTLPETSGSQKIFHASEKTVQSPIKSYKAETASSVFKSKLESSEIQAAENVHEAQDIEVERPIDHEQAEEVEELPVNNQADIVAPTTDDNKSVSTPASTKQQSSLHSQSGQLSPPKNTVTSHSRSNSKLSSKSKDSLAASSGHNSPKTHSNNTTKVNSRAGNNDSKQSKRSNDTVASRKSRTSHHGDT